MIALIPARAGSKRIPGKNKKLLGGKPLIQWTIDATKESCIFSAIYVCTDDDAVAAIASESGVTVIPREVSQDNEPDIAWVRTVLSKVGLHEFAILRPTSPFRSFGAIRRAWAEFRNTPCDSLRAVRPVTEHPGKMWVWQRGEKLAPLLPYWTRTGDYYTDTQWHSAPTQTLPKVYVQTAGLEMVKRDTVKRTESISGTDVLPFLTLDEWEGFDINTPDDWDRAEAHAQTIK
jgi:CMP-N,N'-diacetyllegionaminic acid synthase